MFELILYCSWLIRSIEEKLRCLIQIGNATNNETQENVSEGAVVDSHHDWAYFENQMHEYAGTYMDGTYYIVFTPFFLSRSRLSFLVFLIKNFFYKYHKF